MNSKLDYDKLDMQLQSVKPEKYDDKRAYVLSRIDTLFSEADCERTEELLDFYRKRIDRAITEIREYNGEQPKLWKFYSSGFIVKSKDVVISLDLTRGSPVQDVPFPGKLFISEKQLDELTDLITMSLTTHAHEDHIDLEFARRLTSAGKPVIVPRDGITRMNLPQEIIPSDEPDKIVMPEGWKLNVYYGFQHMSSDPKDDLPCHAFLLTMPNGKTLLIKGDIFNGKEFESILDDIADAGLNIDYVASSPHTVQQPDIATQLLTRFECTFIPAHEWEFSHRPVGQSGKATQNFAELTAQFAKYLAQGRAIMMFWGESIVL